MFDRYAPYREMLPMDVVDSISAVLGICVGVLSGKRFPTETFSKVVQRFVSTFVLIFSFISVL